MDGFSTWEPAQGQPPPLAHGPGSDDASSSRHGVASGRGSMSSGRTDKRERAPAALSRAGGVLSIFYSLVPVRGGNARSEPPPGQPIEAFGLRSVRPGSVVHAMAFAISSSGGKRVPTVQLSYDADSPNAARASVTSCSCSRPACSSLGMARAPRGASAPANRTSARLPRRERGPHQRVPPSDGGPGSFHRWSRIAGVPLDTRSQRGPRRPLRATGRQG